MVITKLQGGLGNQMFQYALGRKLSLHLNMELLLDTSIYGVDKALGDGRLYGLQYFNVTGRDALPEEIRAVGYPHGIFIKKMQDRFERAILRRNHTKFEPSVLGKKGDIYLNGFWQSEKYFKDIRDILLKDFSLRGPLSVVASTIAEIIRKESHSISLHVRRGDYAANEKNIRVYGDHCNPEYYAKALTAIIKDGSHVFIFSDDIKWVQENLDIPCQKPYISSVVPDYEQLVLMSLCHSHIIANSSFSWWGAWLDNKKDTVVAPSVWTPGIDLPIDDILPPGWIKIDVKK
jgi:hypothetical protein